MKQFNRQHLHQLLILFAFTLLMVIKGVTQTVTISMNNCLATSNDVQFDVNVTNEGPSSLQFNNTVIRLTHAPEILKAGTNTLVFSYLGGSDFPLVWPPNSNPTFTYNPASRLFGVATGVGVYVNGTTCAAPTIAPGETKKLGRFSLKNTAQNFVPSANVGFAWNTTTSVTAYINCAQNTTGFTTGNGNRTFNNPCNLAISGTLPIDLLSFSGRNNGSNNILQWSTSSEQNSNYFELQRSTDGSNFVNAHIIPAAGNSSITRNYTQNDDVSTYNSPLFYYRLKMVDLSGAIKYSAIVKIKKNGKAAIVESSPNPFIDRITLQIEAIQSEVATIRLTDLRGRNITQQQSELRTGSNVILLNHFANLPSGVYVLSIISGSIHETLKVIKD